MKEKVFFREGLVKEKNGEYVMVGNRCDKCNQAFFPKEPWCLYCMNKDLEEIDISKRGTLETYSVVYRPINKFPIPHAIGCIRVPEEVRIYCPLILPDLDKRQKGYEADIGTEMEMVIDTLWEEDDKTIIGYKFKPVEK